MLRMFGLHGNLSEKRDFNATGSNGLFLSKCR